MRFRKHLRMASHETFLILTEDGLSGALRWIIPLLNLNSPRESNKRHRTVDYVELSMIIDCLIEEWKGVSLKNAHYHFGMEL